MLIFNAQKNENPFGFENINSSVPPERWNIQSSELRRATSTSSKPSVKRKLTRKNIKFLELLGLKVNKK